MVTSEQHICKRCVDLLHELLSWRDDEDTASSSIPSPNSNTPPTPRDPSIGHSRYFEKKRTPLYIKSLLNRTRFPWFDHSTIWTPLISSVLTFPTGPSNERINDVSIHFDDRIRCYLKDSKISRQIGTGKRIGKNGTSISEQKYNWCKTFILFNFLYIFPIFKLPTYGEPRYAKSKSWNSAIKVPKEQNFCFPLSDQNLARRDKC